MEFLPVHPAFSPKRNTGSAAPADVTEASPRCRPTTRGQPAPRCGQEESMKKLLSAILVLALVSTVVPASFAEPHQVMQGTQVHLTLLNAISTSASRDGDPF